MSLLDSLPHLCSSYYRKRAKDSLGGGKDNWVIFFADKACWVQGASDREINEHAHRGMIVSHKVYFNEDPGLDERHVIQYDGSAYDVRSSASPDASVGLGILWRVMVDRGTTNKTPFV